MKERARTRLALNEIYIFNQLNFIILFYTRWKRISEWMKDGERRPSTKNSMRKTEMKKVKRIKMEKSQQSCTRESDFFACFEITKIQPNPNLVLLLLFIFFFKLKWKSNKFDSCFFVHKIDTIMKNKHTANYQSIILEHKRSKTDS